MADSASGATPVDLPTDLIKLIVHKLPGYLQGRLHIIAKYIYNMNAFFGKSLDVIGIPGSADYYVVAAKFWTSYPVHQINTTSNKFNIAGLTSFAFVCANHPHVDSLFCVSMSAAVGVILIRAASLQRLECEAFALVFAATRGLQLHHLTHLTVISRVANDDERLIRIQVGRNIGPYLLAPKLETINLEQCKMLFFPVENYTTLQHIEGMFQEHCYALMTDCGRRARFPQLKSLTAFDCKDAVSPQLANFLNIGIQRQTDLEVFGARVIMGQGSCLRVCETLAGLKQLKQVNLLVHWPATVSAFDNSLKALEDCPAGVNLKIFTSPPSNSRRPASMPADTVSKRVFLYDNIHSLALARGTFDLIHVNSGQPKSLSSLILLDCEVLLSGAQAHQATFDGIVKPDVSPAPSIFPHLKQFIMTDSFFQSAILSDTAPPGSLLESRMKLGLSFAFRVGGNAGPPSITKEGYPFALYHILSAPLLEEFELVKCSDVSQYRCFMQYIPLEAQLRLFPRQRTRFHPKKLPGYFEPTHCCIQAGECPGLSGKVCRGEDFPRKDPITMHQRREMMMMQMIENMFKNPPK